MVSQSNTFQSNLKYSEVSMGLQRIFPFFRRGRGGKAPKKINNFTRQITGFPSNCLLEEKSDLHSSGCPIRVFVFVCCFSFSRRLRCCVHNDSLYSKLFQLNFNDIFIQLYSFFEKRCKQNESNSSQSNRKKE